ncbi:hypothetical protein [Ancylobacter sp. G4_0304]|uniref:hypothetical protein n=1 Tax=Ancylobacter sp. G4_0304 TaxID=3114289 RepID=UPI0039C71DE4
MAYLFTIYRSGNDFSCRVDGGPPFFVGRRVPYEGRIGLYNIFAGSRLLKIDYDPAAFAGQFGFWAEFILPTAMCEGRNFLTLNTYDRAAFTFGFGQFAAHVPNGDFVQYFRTMLTLPQAPLYFPHLAVIGGRITGTDGAGPLESDASTAALMAYLNPNLAEVQDAEVVAAAKFIHWTATTPAAQSVQVDQMIDTYRGFMRRADHRVGIDGRTAAECCVIADILHQGRGGSMTWPLIQSALNSTNPLEALIKIGAPTWEERRRVLRRALQRNPNFANRRWSRAAGDFV